VRYYLSAGRGGFGLSSDECLRSAFYVVVTRHDNIAHGDSQGERAGPAGAARWRAFAKAAPGAAALRLALTAPPPAPLPAAEHLAGWRVKTSPVPIKPPFFAALKSTNYLPNALAVLDAQAGGFHQGIFVDASGHVAEGPNMNVAALMHDGTLVLPPDGACLAGVTAARAMALLQGALGRGSVDGVARVARRPLSVEEARGAAEVMLLGSSLPVMPVVQWDDARVGDGAPGMAALQLRALLQADMAPREGSGVHTPVPYGYLTGMGA
jgi:4-amino-4-deoxychorismate lyase